ncbi:MAG: DsbE family thiol:disulfide interchange protein [Alphaproteobacteria bacterium]|nr:DsbE family thiol:disulfide interchange protein [Alphaproteobacteria bacterium]
MSSDFVVSSIAAAADKRQSKRFILFVPIAVFVAIAIALAWGLTRDPRLLPPTLIEKPVPQFSLPPVKGRTLGLSTGDLRGEVSIVNVFASWCVECRLEHPLIMQMKAEGVVTIHGLNYKDRPDDAARWLNTLGDPYTRTGADINGRAGIEWGVYGVPETFVISKDGRIAYKHIGPLSAEVLQKKIIPLIRNLQEMPSPQYGSGAAASPLQVNQ